MVSLPRNPMDARVASQRCPILPWGKTPLYYQLQGVMSRVRVALVFSSTWLKYSLSFLHQVAQVFVSKSGSNIGWHVAQIFVDIHNQGHLGISACLCQNLGTYSGPSHGLLYGAYYDARYTAQSQRIHARIYTKRIILDLWYAWQKDRKSIVGLAGKSAVQ